MKITPLAAESMGARSMATFVETEEVNIIIDPGVSLAAERFGLPPHPLEIYQAQKLRERIMLFAQSAHILIVSHFHEDHLIIDAPKIAEGKVVFMKNPNHNIPAGQRRRAFQFLQAIKGLPREIIFTDDRVFDIGSIRFTFSEPLMHGPTDRSGTVISCLIRSTESFLFTSDSRGEYFEPMLIFIQKHLPDILYIDGPETYLKETESSKDLIRKNFEQLKQIIEILPTQEIIMDHALLRDEHWERHSKSVLAAAAERNIRIISAARYRGEENNLLEARRRELYQNHPPESKP